LHLVGILFSHISARYYLIACVNATTLLRVNCYRLLTFWCQNVWHND